jgi:ubiquitin-protein ligase
MADEMARTTTTRRRAPHFEVVSEAQSPPLAAALAASDEDEVVGQLPVAEPSPDYSEMGEVADASAEVSPETSEIEEVPAPAPAKTPVRIRRLMVDAEQMAKAFSGDGPIRIKSAIGDPPELYKIEYHVKGLQKGWFGRPKKRDTHVVEIQLTSEFPRVSPKCRMLTPVFHPNIDDTTVCITDHWTAGERLVDLVVRIGEMLAYQAYNIKSPLNGEAAMWADLNPKQLPVDSRNLHPGEIT